MSAEALFPRRGPQVIQVGYLQLLKQTELLNSSWIPIVGVRWKVKYESVKM